MQLLDERAITIIRPRLSIRDSRRDPLF